MIESNDGNQLAFNRGLEGREIHDVISRETQEVSFKSDNAFSLEDIVEVTRVVGSRVLAHKNSIDILHLVSIRGGSTATWHSFSGGYSETATVNLKTGSERLYKGIAQYVS